MEKFTNIFEDDIAAMHIIAEIAGTPVINDKDGRLVFEGVTARQQRALFYLADELERGDDVRTVEVEAIMQHGAGVDLPTNIDPLHLVAHCLLLYNT